MQGSIWRMQLAVNRCWKRPFDFPRFFYIQIGSRGELPCTPYCAGHGPDNNGCLNMLEVVKGLDSIQTLTALRL